LAKKTDYSIFGWLVVGGGALWCLSRLSAAVAADPATASGATSQANAASSSQTNMFAATASPIFQGPPVYEDNVGTLDNKTDSGAAVEAFDPTAQRDYGSPFDGTSGGLLTTGYRLGDTITIGWGEPPPRPPDGTQWYAPPSGVLTELVTYTLEPVGTEHNFFDPRRLG
jgi:hypothetical protein